MVLRKFQARDHSAEWVVASFNSPLVYDVFRTVFLLDTFYLLVGSAAAARLNYVVPAGYRTTTFRPARQNMGHTRHIVRELRDHLLFFRRSTGPTTTPFNFQKLYSLLRFIFTPYFVSKPQNSDAGGSRGRMGKL